MMQQLDKTWRLQYARAAALEDELMTGRTAEWQAAETLWAFITFKKRDDDAKH